jgi:hypothetical protein
MGKKYNADRIVSVSAIVVSLATLLMILYQTILTREEQHVSVMPSLRIGYGFSDTLDVINERIWLKNDGLGPAFIEKIIIIDSTGSYEEDFFSYFKRINRNRNSIRITRLPNGTIIPKNDGTILYSKYSDSSSTVILSNYFEMPYEILRMPTSNPNKAVVEIYYKSVYGDRWKIRSDSPIPIELD